MKSVLYEPVSRFGSDDVVHARRGVRASRTFCGKKGPSFIVRLMLPHENFKLCKKCAPRLRHIFLRNISDDIDEAIVSLRLLKKRVDSWLKTESR